METKKSFSPSFGSTLACSTIPSPQAKRILSGVAGESMLKRAGFLMLGLEALTEVMHCLRACRAELARNNGGSPTPLLP